MKKSLKYFRPIVVIFCVIFVQTLAKKSMIEAQDTQPERNEPVCTVDLTVPGQMWDILSNALTRGFGKEETEVKKFWKNARGKFKSGRELALAASESFDIKEKPLFAAIEKYIHSNCEHPGGENASATGQNNEISKFAQHVLTHVVLHEIGHALVREFDLPILGNEETLADAFATHYMVTKLPNQSLEILKARITSLMIEANEQSRAEWTVKGEHNSDARRAFQIAAIAIAHDAEKFAPLARLVDMDESDIRKASDYASEIHRSWRRTLAPLWMASNEASRETRVLVQSDSNFRSSIADSQLDQRFARILQQFDWHSQVTINFAGGSGGAGWSRSKRTISIHDDYIERFNRQYKNRADLRSNLPSSPLTGK